MSEYDMLFISNEQHLQLMSRYAQNHFDRFSPQLKRSISATEEGVDWLAKAATDMAKITESDQAEWPKPSDN
jgi:hypothetical protein